MHKNIRLLNFTILQLQNLTYKFFFPILISILIYLYIQYISLLIKYQHCSLNIRESFRICKCSPIKSYRKIKKELYKERHFFFFLSSSKAFEPYDFLELSYFAFKNLDSVNFVFSGRTTKRQERALVYFKITYKFPQFIIYCSNPLIQIGWAKKVACGLQLGPHT